MSEQSEPREPLTEAQAREILRLFAVGWEVVVQTLDPAAPDHRFHQAAVGAGAAAVGAVTGRRDALPSLPWQDRQLLERLLLGEDGVTPG